MPLDMREVEPGSVIDEFHFSMWAGFIEFALKKDEMRAEFEAETGVSFPKSPANGLEIAIDKACGFDREADQMKYVADFARWATPLYFGGPEDICPAIAAKLADVSQRADEPRVTTSAGRPGASKSAAKAIEARSAQDNKDWLGPKGESPVAEGDAPNPKGSIHDPGQ